MTPNAKKSGIKINPSHKGLLHQDVGKPAGQKLTLADILAAARSANPAERKRAIFAENARNWNHARRG